MAKPILNEADQKRIADAVAAAEMKTSGEIVPVVLERSDDYPDALWRVAFAFSMALALGLYLALPDIDPLWCFAAQFPGVIIGYAFAAGLEKIPVLFRGLVWESKMEEEVHQRALEAFFNHNLHSTRDRTGILILVSLLEHRVEIVADSGINAKVPPGTWDKVIADLIAGVKAGGDLADGICVAIQECGELLAKEFPRREGDVNELPNQLR